MVSTIPLPFIIIVDQATITKVECFTFKKNIILLTFIEQIFLQPNIYRGGLGNGIPAIIGNGKNYASSEVLTGATNQSEDCFMAGSIIYFKSI